MSRTTPLSSVPARPLAGRRHSGRTVALVAMAFAVVLAGCGSDGSKLGGKVIKDGVGCTITKAERNTAAPEVKAGAKVGKEVKTKDLEPAEKKACTADAEHYLTLDLVGATASDGKTFNTTFGTDRPITARLGTGQLIAGLDTGLAGMKVGARRQILVPASQAYGKDGLKSEGIGANADLIFVVDLVAATDSPIYCNEATSIPKGTVDGKPTTVEMPVKAPVGKVETTVINEGTGPVSKASSYLTVNYLGIACSTGTQFASSWDDGQTLSVALPKATPTEVAQPVIEGWNDGMVGQKEGSLVQINIPFEKAYGADGRAPTIGPSEPLVFVVEIVKVSSKAPPTPTTTTQAVPSTTAAPAGSTTTTAPAATTTTKG